MNQELLAQRLKAARENTGLSVRDAAEKLGYPDDQTLTSIENGERKVTVAELNQFARPTFVFQVDFSTSDILSPFFLINTDELNFIFLDMAGGLLITAQAL